MTLREYLQKYYANINDYAGIIDDTGDYSILHELFFPNYGILNTNRLNEINYLPFIYENTPYSDNYYGGRIVYDISEYIGENYYDNNNIIDIPALSSALKFPLQIEFRYLLAPFHF